MTKQAFERFEVKAQDLEMELKTQSEKQANCEHSYQFLRKDARDVNPGQWHGEKEIFDIFYCTKCLQYKEVSQGRMSYDAYAFSQNNQ